MQKVGILLSTYNGEKYLKEQLDSILRQHSVEIELFIRDDGSSDHTNVILSEYANSDKRVHVSFGENVGVGNSFMNLLYTVPETFDYYGFSDQDDIWDEEKIIEAINALRNSKCSLYASNQECIDKDGKYLYMRYSDRNQMHLTPLSIMCQNTIAGCTFVFDSKLFKLLKERQPSSELLRLRIHDVWVAMAAAITGSIYYDNKSYIKYRQHDNNVVGAEKDSWVDVIKMQFGKVRDSSQRNGRSMIAQEAVKCFPESVEEADLLRVCGNPKTIRNKLELIRHSSTIRNYTKESWLGFIIKVLIGLF